MFNCPGCWENPCACAADRTLELPKELHEDTRDMLIRQFKAIAEKLLVSQKKYNLTNGWRYPPPGMESGDGRFFNVDDYEALRIAVLKHIEKGDLLDVISYLLFMRELGMDVSELLTNYRPL
jgi:hypothetical protein